MLLHALGDLDASGIGRNDHRVLGVLADVVLDHGHRREVIDRTVEKSLDLPAVQVDRHHAPGASRAEHVGNETRSDGLATLGLAVLSRVSVERTHGRDAFCRRAIRGIDHDQLLHDRVVDRTTIEAVVRLHDEDVATAHRIGEARTNLTVRELDDVCIAETNAEVRCNFFRESGVGATGEE